MLSLVINCSVAVTTIFSQAVFFGIFNFPVLNENLQHYCGKRFHHFLAIFGGFSVALQESRDLR